MTEPFIEPLPISQMEQISIAPSGTSLVPAIIWNPNKLGPNVGGWESKAVPVALLATALVNKLISGHGPPTTLTGVDGDVYIDLDTFEFYNPKTLDVWPLPPVAMLATVQLAAVNQANFAAIADAAARRARSIADSLYSRVAPLLFSAASEARRAKKNASDGAMQIISAGETKIAGYMSRASRSARRASAEADRASIGQMLAIAIPQSISRQIRSKTANDVATAIVSQLLIIQGYMSKAAKAAVRASSEADRASSRTILGIAAVQQISRVLRKQAANDVAVAIAGYTALLQGLASKAAKSVLQAKSAADQVQPRLFVQLASVQMAQKFAAQAKQSAAQVQMVSIGEAAMYAEAARSRRIAKSYVITLTDDQIALKATLFT